MATLRWAWVEHEGKAQPTTFETAEEAIHVMAQRIGLNEETNDPRALLVRINQVGFRLAVARVEVVPVLMMDEVKR